MGETLRRLAGKCVCAILKERFSDFFHPLQYGVACWAGAEKVIHQVRDCIEEHWMDDDFVFFKMDMKNASFKTDNVPLSTQSYSYSSFPPSVRSSLLPNLDILGAPIGDYLHCTHFM